MGTRDFLLVPLTGVGVGAVVRGWHLQTQLVICHLVPRVETAWSPTVEQVPLLTMPSIWAYALGSGQMKRRYLLGAAARQKDR